MKNYSWLVTMYLDAKPIGMMKFEDRESMNTFLDKYKNIEDCRKWDYVTVEGEDEFIESTL